jgi:hypothetical protein
MSLLFTLQHSVQSARSIEAAMALMPVGGFGQAKFAYPLVLDSIHCCDAPALAVFSFLLACHAAS